MSRALVLLSGGLDSCVAAAILRDRGDTLAVSLNLNYESKHQTVERSAAVGVSQALGFDVHLDKDVTGLFKGSSALLQGGAEMPHQTYQELSEHEGPSATYVPYRNGTFISMAAATAIAYDCDLVVIGAHAEDAHNWAYPDCTPEFLGAQAAAVLIGSYNQVRLEAPLQWMSKADIAMRGYMLDAPLELTWSCYEPIRHGDLAVPCGLCPTCIGRAEAFRLCGASDPATGMVVP